MIDQPDIQTLWGALLLEECSRQGVEHVVVAPGSRSTPLVVAAARHARLQVHVCVDERGAGYLALGLGRATGRPAVVITTSGTAVANLLPAIVEASIDGVPLVALTADRPPELLDAGANQTIRQPGIFGDYPRWQGELPPPVDTIPARAVLTTVAHAVSSATTLAGPVHLNCQFREPLEPTPSEWNRDCLAGLDRWLSDDAPFTRVAHATKALDAADADRIASALTGAGSGLVITTRPIPSATRLASQLGFCLWTDVRSGLRLGRTDETITPHVDHLLDGWEPPPVAIVQLGERPTSKRLQQFLDRHEFETFVQVSERPARIDPGHRVTQRVVANPETWCQDIASRLPDAPTDGPAEMLARDRAIETAIDRALEDDGTLTEPGVARSISRLLPEGSGLFLSSSMPIRDFQSYSARDGAGVPVAANRGASGIDGVLATAIGWAIGLGRPVTLAIGDLALVHDLSSLDLLARTAAPVTVIVLNNGGGGIFRNLPIAAHADVARYFDTPHDRGFGGACADAGIPHHAVSTANDLTTIYRASVDRGAPTVIECAVPAAATATCRQRLAEAIRAAASR